VKLQIQIGNDDIASDSGGNPWTWNTDEAAARAVYELINIPNEDKDFVRVLSDTDPAHTYDYDGTTYNYTANHYISYSGVSNGQYQPYDRLDVYAVNRMTDAMLSYVFEGIQSAKNIALGGGSAGQVAMDIMPSLVVEDAPIITRITEQFKYKCDADTGWSDSGIWKLSDYCGDIDDDGIIDLLDFSTRADVNNSAMVNTSDALLSWRDFLSLDMATTNWIGFSITGDVNCDGDTDSDDVQLILRRSMGLNMEDTAWCE